MSERDVTPDSALTDPPPQRARARNVLAGLGFAAASFGAAAFGGLAMRGKGRPDGAWYQALDKPSFQPPSWLFAPVWSALYGAIAYSGYRIYQSPDSPERSTALKLWATQLALNAAWTPTFFGARRPGLALGDIAALDAAATAYVVVAAKVDKRAAQILAPYLAWLGFATVLNASIVVKNRDVDVPG